MDKCIQFEISKPVAGALLPTWINFNPTMDK